MKRRHWETSGRLIGAAALLLLAANLRAAAQPKRTDFLNDQEIAGQHFGHDAPWFETNIPFFDCSDPEITQIYYYRWKLYKAHLRDLGERGYIVTEFLDDVGWAKSPYQSLNDATAFHIYEGRWLKDRRYIDDYIDYMYTGGGNDRHFSESIADAVYAHYLVTGDRAFATKHIDTMQHIFNLWDDHFDFSKGLYFIEPLLDATEYTISSIDASGGKDGFFGGQAFRPTINSYMYADAQAISRLSSLQGDAETAETYAAKAARIKKTVQDSLWSEPLQHFIDRYQAGNEYVHYWDRIRGRELAGYAPWAFNLPDHDPRYAAAWRHLLSPTELGGPYGIRTVEPSYEYYMKQYRYDQPTGNPECQWNGPSWPFQTSQALLAMANLLNNYTQDIVQPADYLRLLKQYAQQHLVNGLPDLQEDYNPDTGQVIVGLPRSHHYNHSEFNDLIITGLAGLRPQPDNTLVVNPLIPAGPDSPGGIRSFCLENAPYHGHLVTIVYDRDGTRYHKGAGLSVYVDGKLSVKPSPLGRKVVPVGPPIVWKAPAPVNRAVNLTRRGFPAPAASVNNKPEALYPAIDGRVWFFSNVLNGWTTAGSQNAEDWYAIDFGQTETIRSIRLYFYADGAQFAAPAACTIQYWTGTAWEDAPHAQKTPAAPLANGENRVVFSRPVATAKLRAVLTNPKNASVSLVEFKAF